MAEGSEDPLIVGRITGVHGLKGWLKLRSYTDPAENILDYDGLVMKRQGQWLPLEVDASRIQGKGLVIHIEGIDDRTGAEVLGKCDVAMPVDSLPALDEDEFYWHQLEGLQIFLADDSGEMESNPASNGSRLLGLVDSVMATGANDVLSVLPCINSRDDKKRLIPYLSGQVIKRVDLINGLIEVDWDPDF
ncbi:MAG: 16S rRNA processing protein RimM [Halieaceae bacterium]